MLQCLRALPRVPARPCLLAPVRISYALHSVNITHSPIQCNLIARKTPGPLTCMRSTGTSWPLNGPTALSRSSVMERREAKCVARWRAFLFSRSQTHYRESLPEVTFGRVHKQCTQTITKFSAAISNANVAPITTEHLPVSSRYLSLFFSSINLTPFSPRRNTQHDFSFR